MGGGDNHCRLCLSFILWCLWSSAWWSLLSSGLESLAHPSLALRAKDGCLVVDDVYETGQTLSSIRDQVDATFVVWMSKVPPEWWNAAITVSSDEWLVFPWENVDLAAEDEARYRASRSKTP